MKSIILSFAAFFMALTSFAHDHGRQSFEFVENQNQWHENVLFKANIPGGTLFLEDNCFTYKFYNVEDRLATHDLQFASLEEQNAHILNGHAWKLHFVNSLTPTLEGEKKMKHYYNYFKGSDESKWSSNVGVFASIYYNDLYEGVNLRAYNKNNNFKYDFIVQPNANPNQIVLSLEGIESPYLEDGNLMMPTSLGTFKEMAPFAFQFIDGKIIEVACNYVMVDGNVSFEFPNGYDENYKLTIDPELIASTLSGTGGGGFSDNYGHTATFDFAGNIYTGCISFDSEYPVTTGVFQDSYGGGGTDYGISKLTFDGTDLIWATFIGGNGGDYPHSMIANSAEELYVMGSTSSSDFPTSTSAYQDTFGGEFDIAITALSADGTALIGSTYLGGDASDGRNMVSVNYGDASRGEIVLDYQENPVVAAFTSSDDFPTTATAYQTANAGGQDAIVSRLSPNLSNLEMSTYMGSSGEDVGYGVKVATNGDVFLVGTAGADDFNTTAGAYQTEYLGGEIGWAGEGDGFVASFNSAGSVLNACTYYGTTDGDQVFFIDLDTDENVFIFGQGGTDLPIVGDVYSNPGAQQFIAKLDNSLATLELATTFGGGGFGGYNLVPDAFLVDNCNNIYISGYSANGDLEATDDALYDTGGFYLAAFTENIEELEYGTYYTGDHVDGGTSRFDKNGTVYQAVCSGGGFATTADAWATDQDVGWDIGVFKINFDVSGVNAASSANDLTGCAPFEVNFSNYSTGDQYEWDFGDGTTSTEFEPTYIYNDPGVYEVSLIVTDSLSCNIADTLSFEVVISTPFDFIPTFTATEDCESLGVICDNTTGIDFLEYVWDMGDGTIIESENAEYSYEEPGIYTISLIAIDNGCDADETVVQEIEILPTVVADIDSEGIEGCGEIEVTFGNESTNADSYFWDFGDGTTSSEETPTHSFTGPGSFEVTLTASNALTCNGNATEVIEILVGDLSPITSEFQLVQTDCENLLVSGTNLSDGFNLTYEWDMGDGTTYDSEDIDHSYAATGAYTVTLTITDELCDQEDVFESTVNVAEEVTAIIGNGDQQGCEPFDVTFINGSAGTTFTWDFGDGSPLYEGQSANHTYDEPGNYTVTLTVEGSGTCDGTDVTTSEIEVVAAPEILSDFEAIQTAYCNQLTVELINNSIGTDVNYNWDFGDGDTSTDPNPIHQYDAAGNYTVTLTLTEDVCEQNSVSQDFVILNTGLDFNIGPDVPICWSDESVEISAGDVPDSVDFQWSTEETESTIEVSEPGIYTVEVLVDNCWVVDGLEVFLVEEMSLLDEVTVCEGLEARLEVPPYSGTPGFEWCTGEDNFYITIDEPGEVCYDFIDELGCPQAGSFNVNFESNNPVLFIPNAFTPDQDNVNEQFKPVGDNLDEYHFEVYNRWGEKIFETYDQEQGWIGDYNGGTHFVPNGTYTYKVTFSGGCNSERDSKIGTITVIR